VLIGRRRECGRVDALLDEMRRGSGGVLVLSGEPGIGKSALLGYARRRGGDCVVLEARGIEGEGELAFAALADLLRPLLGRLEAIPPLQAQALSGALALAPPVEGDRFAVAAGSLGLLAAAAAERPVLVLVDDAHWIDLASAETLRFVAHRLHRDRVAMLVARRPDEASAFDPRGLPELRVEGLSGRDAEELLRRHASKELSAPVARHLVEEARGNPLALAEVAGTLSGAQLRGIEPLPDPLPAGRGLDAAFRRRLDALPEDVGDALVVAAAAGERLEAAAAALPALGLGPAQLESAEAAGVLDTSDGRLSWRHPLLRSVAYTLRGASARRAAHRALADVLDPGSPARAWHLAAATTGEDDAVAALLEDVAEDARLRRGHAAAGTAFERAAELSSDHEARARRFLEAARDHHTAGRTERARALLDLADRETADPILEADIAAQRGVVEMWGGDRGGAHRLLTAASARVVDRDPARAAGMLVAAGIAAQMSSEVQPTIAIARTAASLRPQVPAPLQHMIDHLLVNSLVLAGETGEAEALLARLIPSLDEQVHDLQSAATFGHTLTWLERYEEARRVFERQRRHALNAGALGYLPFLEACMSEVEFRTGDWDAAEAAAREAVRLSEETGQENLLSFALVTLARVEAGRGRAADCRAHAERAVELAERLDAGSIVHYAWTALGLLELGTGDVEAAAGRLSDLSDLVHGCGLREPGVLQWRPDLIEALALAGRVEEARSELRTLEAEAAATRRPWALAGAARCRAMLAEDDDLSGFDEALRLHGTGVPFERARTELRLGERLRRLRRPADAREPLRRARGAFELLGAAPWAERAGAELAATGSHRRRQPRAPAGLTPQELRIAALVAAGETNRSIGAALFLSPKTVSYHLAKVYDKLGVNSRAQLAALIAGGGVAEEPPPPPIAQA
jgi:DNA-binding CsgD family transcriptional regulator